jgi:two-component system, chemotaxis family, response regulator WspF
MRIAIVNDVLLAVEAMRRVILGAGEHRLAWIARDGAEAVERCASDTPDLILMDLIMPKMDGVEATRRIMNQSPCAIVVVTANVNDATSKVFEALGAGALDAVNTPVLESSHGGEGAKVLLAKIETIRKLIGSSGTRKNSIAAEPPRAEPGRSHAHLIAIGASAGGPSALAKVLADLPASFPAPIVIVQHVDVQFAAGLADWLNYQTPLAVRLAREGDRPQPGTVLLAGGENHLVFASPTRLTYSREPVECSYRPSVDVFFKSANRMWPGDLIGVVLTGMGRDGAEGLLAIHDNGHYTIAQDEATSAVYGMPKAAAECHAATEILGLERIGPRLSALLSESAKLHG